MTTLDKDKIKYGILHITSSKLLVASTPINFEDLEESEEYCNTDHKYSPLVFNSKEEAKFYIELHKVRALSVVSASKYSKSIVADFLALSSPKNYCYHAVTCQLCNLSSDPNQDAIPITESAQPISTKKLMEELHGLLQKNVIKFIDCLSLEENQITSIYDELMINDIANTYEEYDPDGLNCCNAVSLEHFEIVEFVPPKTPKKLVLRSNKEKEALAALLEEIQTVSSNPVSTKYKQLAEKLGKFLN